MAQPQCKNSSAVPRTVSEGRPCDLALRLLNPPPRELRTFVHTRTRPKFVHRGIIRDGQTVGTTEWPTERTDRLNTGHDAVEDYPAVKRRTAPIDPCCDTGEPRERRATWTIRKKRMIIYVLLTSLESHSRDWPLWLGRIARRPRVWTQKKGFHCIPFGSFELWATQMYLVKNKDKLN